MQSVWVTGQPLWDRMNSAVDKVQQRLERTVKILTNASIPYAVIGGNAVRAWVAQADESAVRNTRDVDIILNREDRDRAIEAMQQAGFIFRVVKGIPMFLDGPDAKARERQKTNRSISIAEPPLYIHNSKLTSHT